MFRMGRRNEQGRWREDEEQGEDTVNVLLYHLQVLYRAVSDQRDKFNEAVFLAFSRPLLTSPQMPLRLPCHPPLSLSPLLRIPCSPSSFVLICPFHVCSLLFHL